MKKPKLLLLPLCLLLVLFSCKKNSTSPNVTGTFTATIGGKTITFNTGAQAHLNNAGGFNTLSMEGVQSTTTPNSMIIAITTTEPITAKTYTDAGSEAQMSYTVATGSVYQDYGADGTSGTVTIKSITSTNVQGTFSGTLALLTGTGPATETVTNGTFNLDIK